MTPQEQQRLRALYALPEQEMQDPLDGPKPFLAGRPPMENQQPQPDQAQQMAALYQMYAANTPQGDTYRSPQIQAARAMASMGQEATPGSTLQGGVPVVAPLTPQTAAPGAAQPQMQIPQFVAQPIQRRRYV